MRAPSGGVPIPCDAVIAGRGIPWPVVALVRYRGLRFHGLKHIAIYLPYLLWMELLWEERVFTYNSEYAKAIVYAFIACQLINHLLILRLSNHFS